MVLGSYLRGRSGRLGALTAGAVLALALTGCGEGGKGDSAASVRMADRTTSVVATPSASPSAAQPADPGAAKKEITANWEKFFNSHTSKKDRQAVLENGKMMGPVLDALSRVERGRQISAKVTKVEFTSATDAKVTYSLLMKGATVLPNAKGTAVEQNGTWKVSVKTLCGLIKLSGQRSVPGC
ncbi:hypothetical protein FPZ41_06630 [Streptomyces sp. K1PN6]|uniref:Low molecular weight antigen MTB12-like C-terminal domain-containing protein n=2 Tax=Streptomyces acidicola TaxID=2596892 RepID=A0A5N8WLE0_9ACTN|nr:hypothetical protein [Streptomyces acidicola]